MEQPVAGAPMSSSGRAVGFAAGALVGALLTSLSSRDAAPTAPLRMLPAMAHRPVAAAAAADDARAASPSAPSKRRSRPRRPRGHHGTAALPQPQPAADMATERHARTHGPFYGDLERAGEFERCVRTVSRGGELVLLHGDGNRLRMVVNLIACLLYTSPSPRD